MGNWPFEDPPNVAVFTQRQIMDEGEPILLVSHDDDDGAWQFLTGGPCKEEDAMVVALRGMLEHDASIGQLADLPLGWRAWRKAPGKSWEREPK